MIEILHQRPFTANGERFIRIVIEVLSVCLRMNGEEAIVPTLIARVPQIIQGDFLSGRPIGIGRAVIVDIDVARIEQRRDAGWTRDLGHLQVVEILAVVPFPA